MPSRRILPVSRVRTTRGGIAAASAIVALILSLVVAAPVAAQVPTAPTEAAAAGPRDVGAVAGGIADAGMVKTAVSGFNPENIISDALFYDGNAMSSAEIQAFLDAKIGACSNGKCLNVLTVSAPSTKDYYSQTTGDLVCSAMQGGTMRASELIYRVQVACGISAKVTLVTLQKEQSLTTNSAPTDTDLRKAMGHLCPDTADCDSGAAGFVAQIMGGVEQLKKYKATAFGKQPGRNWIGYNPDESCGGTYLNIQNYATAALYNFTPYQPNAAALAAGTGFGNLCSSYGNRNFYNFYTNWFGSTQGAVDPFGNLDVVEARPGVFAVSGWAIDPDTTGSIDVHVWVDNASATTFSAGGPRPDVAAVYRSYGASHGFSGEVPAVGPGPRTVCAYAINVHAGNNVKLGCATVTAMSGRPFGYLDSVEAVAGGARVAGWAIDPDTTRPLAVEVRVDRAVTAATADIARSDLARAYREYGGQHGYSTTVPASVGVHTVCVYAKNVASGEDTQLGCRDVQVLTGPDAGKMPVGSLDEVRIVGRTAVVRGWAWDEDSSSSVAVRVSAGDRGTSTTAAGSRPDVATVFPSAGTSRGYSTALRLEPGVHRVCATAINTGVGADGDLGCSAVTVPAPEDTSPIGSLDEVVAGPGAVTVRGWTFDPDGPGVIAVQISLDSATVNAVADKPRADIGKAHSAYGEQHGYLETLAAKPGVHRVCVSAINDLDGRPLSLGCRTVTVPAPVPDRLPIGQVDEVTVSSGMITVRGWAIDPDTADSIGVHVYVDDAVTKGRADQERVDIARVYPDYGAAHGFALTVPAGPGPHTVCAYGIGDVRDGNSKLGCRTVTVPAPVPDRLPIGQVDEVTVSSGMITVRGWAIDPDTADSIGVHVYVDDAVTKGRADQERVDIARVYPDYGAAHGFALTVPAGPGPHTVCAYGIGDVRDGNSKLGCTTVSIP